MKKCAVGLLSLDKEYTERLLAYVRLSEYRTLVHMVWYTSVDYCRKMLAEKDKPEVLLLDTGNSAAGWQALLQQKECPIVLLGEEETTTGSQEAAMLDKYQPLNRLLDTILHLAEKQSGTRGRREAGGEETFVLGVYSSTGGAGKTVFAYTAAGLLSRMGFHPLVLTLESIPSLCWRVPGNEDRFGKVMYRVAGGTEEGQQGLGPELSEDAGRRVRFLPGASNLDDLEEMGQEDARKLIRLASQTVGVNLIIVDLDSSFHPRIWGALSACHRIAWLIPDHCIAREKAERQLPRLLEEMPVLKDRLSVILNMSGGQPQDLQGGAIQIEEVLPHQEDWLFLRDCRHLETSTAYEQRLQKWFLSVIQSPAGWAGAKSYG
ncbi:hypothetical protein [Paenibacillus mesotrionivorans]|uniref:Uncharacterized protein n=1 Tax=Paenibacillus mesotrionivorans TaxID=3160968 RepID=A0ACC7NSR9_9BACL